MASEGNLAAVQNRFIKAFVCKAPKLDPKYLPESGAFQRIHGILGMYMHIMTTMESYSPKDFFSPVMRQYVLHGLCSKLQTYIQVVLLRSNRSNSSKPDTLASSSRSAAGKIKEEATPKEVDLRMRLRALVEKHIDLPLQHSLLKYLKT